MAEFNQQHQNVLQQFNADTINIFRGEQAEITSARWRQLEELRYPMLKNDEARRSRLLQELLVSVDDACRGEGYTRFSALSKLDQIRLDGQDTFVLTLVSHHARFISCLRRTASDRVRQLSELQDKLAGLDENAKLVEIVKVNTEHKKKLSDTWRDWQLRGSLTLSNNITPFEIIYDSDNKLVSVSPLEIKSLDPRDYPEHLNTTSELLQWVGTLFNSSIAVLGDIMWTAKNYSIAKLFACLLDTHTVDLDSIRIAVNDKERWDYNYGQLDEELLYLST